ncbi:SRPBCC family protein [Micromonospora chersina]
MWHWSTRRRDKPAEARGTIDRRVADVYTFYRDFANLPRFLGDVMASEQIGPGTFRWAIRGPLGVRVHSTVRLVEERPNQLLRYETTARPGMRSDWTARFTAGSDPGRTEVHEVLRTPFGRVGRVALTLVGKPPGAEVAANLRRLKQLLETGEVTDTEHAVAGKFARAVPADHRRLR